MEGRTEVSVNVIKITNVADAVRVMADAAIEQGADANDTNGVVRAIVLAHGLGFNAWLCVCCEIADRAAQKNGFKNQADQALHSPGFLAAKERYLSREVKA